MTQTVTRYPSTSLPSAIDFAAYEDICPGAARDILDMAKQHQTHLQTMERAEFWSEIFGKSLAVPILISFISAVVYLSAHDHEWVAGTLFTSGSALIGSVAYFFDRQKQPAPKDNKEQNRAHRKRRR